RKAFGGPHPPIVPPRPVGGFGRTGPRLCIQTQPFLLVDRCSARHRTRSSLAYAFRDQTKAGKTARYYDVTTVERLYGRGGGFLRPTATAIESSKCLVFIGLYRPTLLDRQPRRP